MKKPESATESISQEQDFQKPRSVFESITIYLRDAILSGKMQPGERINEKEMSERLNVSRSPIREALRTLAREELVTISPHKGAAVPEISVRDLKHTCEVRDMIELFAVDLIEAHQVTDFEEMEDSVDLDIEDLKKSDFSVYVKQVTRFHLALVRAAENDKLFRLYEVVNNSLIRYQSLKSIIPDRLEVSVVEHRAILQALTRRDFREAKELLRRHFGVFISEMERLLETGR